MRKGRGNREVLLAMLSPWLELENTHCYGMHLCYCVIFSSKPGGPRAGKKAHSCIMGWNGMLPETRQKDKGMKQTRVLARDQLQWGPWNVGQE